MLFGLLVDDRHDPVAVDREAHRHDMRSAVGADGGEAGDGRRRDAPPQLGLVHQPATDAREVELGDVRDRERAAGVVDRASDARRTAARVAPDRGADGRTGVSSSCRYASRVVVASATACSGALDRRRTRSDAIELVDARCGDRRPGGDFPGIRAPSSGATRSYTASISWRSAVSGQSGRFQNNASAPSSTSTVARLRQAHGGWTQCHDCAAMTSVERQDSRSRPSPRTTSPRRSRPKPRAVPLRDRRHVRDRARARSASARGGRTAPWPCRCRTPTSSTASPAPEPRERDDLVDERLGVVGPGAVVDDRRPRRTRAAVRAPSPLKGSLRRHDHAAGEVELGGDQRRISRGSASRTAASGSSKPSSAWRAGSMSSTTSTPPARERVDRAVETVDLAARRVGEHQVEAARTRGPRSAPSSRDELDVARPARGRRPSRSSSAFDVDRDAPITSSRSPSPCTIHASPTPAPVPSSTIRAVLGRRGRERREQRADARLARQREPERVGACTRRPGPQRVEVHSITARPLRPRAGRDARAAARSC